MNKFYDKNGRPCTILRRASLCELPGYRRIGFDENNKYSVSTVWLGMNHASIGDEKVIFETRVCKKKDGMVLLNEIYQERYTTESQAKAGHKKAVDKFLLEK